MNDGETTQRPGDEVVAELVQLSARIDAAVQRQMALIREVHERELWFVWGLRTFTEWLGWRLGIGPGAARERTRVALALGELPKIDEALGKGQVSFSKVRAMTRVATAENEADLLNVARNATAAQLERICRGMRQVAKQGEQATAATLLEPDREVSVRGFADGTARMTIVVAQDEAAQVLGVIDRVRAALRAEAGDGAQPERADALVRMAMLADEALRAELDHDSDSDSENRTPRTENRLPTAESENRTPAAKSENRLPTAESESRTPMAESESRTPAAECENRSRPTPRARTGADHAMIALHFQPEMLGDGFTALLDDGTRVPAETFRRIACDCALTATISDDEGEPLDAGRKTRAISPSLRRALDRRDGGCRFPGCRCTRFLHAHHVEHWAHGGETKLDNLVTLCPFHHRLVHEEGFTLTMNESTPLFRTPDGVPIPDVPAETPPDGPLHQSTGPLRTDIDIDANLFWLQRRPGYQYIVSAMVQ